MAHKYKYKKQESLNYIQLSGSTIGWISNIIILDMYNSNYSSSHKRDHANDTTYIYTTEKLRYPGESDSFNHTPVKSYYQSGIKPSSERVQSARRDINQIISMVSDKKRMNQEAINEIRQVNQEIAEHYNGGFNKSKANVYDSRNRTAEQMKQQNPRNYETISHFSERTTNSENINRNLGQGEFQQVNMQLRARLNAQLKKNNEMLHYISTLQAQNNSLRSSNQGQNINSLIEQNRSLRNQLANARSKSGIPYNLIEELQNLKEQNNKLRKETVAMLKIKMSN